MIWITYLAATNSACSSFMFIKSTESQKGKAVFELALNGRKDATKFMSLLRPKLLSIRNWTISSLPSQFPLPFVHLPIVDKKFLRFLSFIELQLLSAVKKEVREWIGQHEQLAEVSQSLRKITEAVAVLSNWQTLLTNGRIDEERLRQISLTYPWPVSKREIY